MAIEREMLGDKHLATPHPPSWVDRFMDWVDRLPGPASLFYIGLGLILYLLELLIQADSGNAGFYPSQMYIIVAPAALLSFIHYLDRAADQALSKFRPALDCSDEDYAELRYRLTTMPARPTLLVILFGIAINLVLHVLVPVPTRVQLYNIADTPLSLQYFAIIAGIVSCVGTIFVYHTFHQLRTVSLIYARYTRVDVFHLGPLYEFSNLSVRTAIGLLAITYLGSLAIPNVTSNWLPVTSGLFANAVAVLTFVLPLLGVHRLLVEEKERLLQEATHRLEATITDLYQRIDSGKIEGMDDLNKAMSSLEITQAALRRISTWPWQPETLRGLLAALLFPVVVWLTQWVLQRVLSP